MKITSTFNEENKRVVYMVECNLLNNYTPAFLKLLEKYKKLNKLPKSISVEKGRECNQIMLLVPPYDEKSSKVVNGIASVLIDSKVITAVNDFLDCFVNAGLTHELKRNEFIPLEGYPEDKLSEEIIDAYNSKRNLCIVKNYKEYDNRVKNGFRFTQKIIPYGSEEYVDAAIMIRKRDISSLKKKYLPELKLTEWC